MASEHRADSLFALPELPARVALFGDPPGWRQDLAERGIEVVKSGAVAVASADLITAALASGAASVVVDGDPAAAKRLTSAGLGVRRLLPVPVHGSPILFADLAHRRAARYAFDHVLVHPERWRTLRNRLAGLVVGAGLPLRSGALVSVGTRSPGPPGLLLAAEGLGVSPGSGWTMVVSQGSIVRRNAMLLFPPGAKEPELVLKFGRVPDMPLPFDREERGAGLAAAAGAVVTRHAPRYLGRGEFGTLHFSGETAALGTKLVTLLRRPGSRESKLRTLEPIARWLIEVAAATAAPGASLEPERARFEREVLPFWREEGATPELAAALPPGPGALQHNDMAEENLVVGRETFTALDWEWVNPCGLPLGDLVYFAVHVLRLVDGALDDGAGRDAHFLALCRGEAPSSPVLFRWLGEVAGRLGLVPEALGPIVLLGWLDRGKISKEERLRAEGIGGAPLGKPFGERAAELWLRTPGLGADWSAGPKP